MNARQSFNKKNLVFGKETINECYLFILYNSLNLYVSEFNKTDNLDLKKIIGDLLHTFIKMIHDNKTTLNMTQNEMYSKLLKYREIEKSEITTYLRDITDELREIENVMKNNRLGNWSKGQTKGLVTYDANTYDGEMLQQDIRDQSDSSSLDIGSLELAEHGSSQQDIDNEIDNISHLGEDDNFEDLDGDEGF